MDFKSKYKNEKDFQKDYMKYLKEEWLWVYKLPDVWYALKPCDIIWCVNGKFIWIELKYGRVDTYDKIYKMLRPNQVWWLSNIQKNGWESYVVWWDNKDNKMYKYTFKYQKYEWAL